MSKNTIKDDKGREFEIKDGTLHEVERSKGWLEDIASIPGEIIENAASIVADTIDRTDHSKK
jgi:hypothetical protein